MSFSDEPSQLKQTGAGLITQANPADSAEVIAEFDRVRTPDIEWVVLHRWAFWWADEFPEFCAYLESISTQVERRPWIVAYRLAPG